MSRRTGPRPAVGRARLGILAALAAAWALAPAAAVASALEDPFLERFRVGADLEAAALAPEKLAPHGGYPAGLLEPCRLDTAWAAAAASYFAGNLPPQGPGLLAWRILRPALGPVEATRDWFGARRDRAQRLLALAARVEPLPAAADTGAAGPRFLLAETLQLEAARRWQTGDYPNAALLVELLLARAGELDLPSEAAFVWSLRLRRLRELAGGPREEAPWPELWDLGPFDREGGWALWRAHRRAIDAPVLPPGTAPERLASLLRRLRQHGLGPAELAAAGLDSAAAALLGAASLEGEELRRLLDGWPAPPADPDLQAAWISARRRLDDGVAALESLGARADLEAGQRMELWRLAADRRLGAGEWEQALSDLEQALTLAGGASSGRRARLQDQLLQAAALAEARRRASGRDGVLGMVGRLGSDAAGLRRDLAEFGLGPAPPESAAGAGAPPERPDLERVAVRQGKAAELGASRDPDLPSAVTRANAALWETWSRWGRGLLADVLPSGLAALGWASYGAGLQAAAEAASPPAGFAIACAAAGRALRGSDLVDPVGDWLLARDLAAGRPDLPPALSPLPALAGRLRGAGDRLLRHALLGVSLAAGDGRGQIALTLGLPSRGILTPDERLRFLYPVPESLVPHLAGGGVEAPLVLAIVRNESLFEPAARSRAGALGLLQVMPFHYPERGSPGGRPVWRLPGVSLGTGTRLLAQNAARYGRDPYRATAAYNAGPGAVDRWDRQLGGGAGRGLFLAWIGYPETRTYTEKVLIDRAVYAWILASPGS